MCVCVWKYVENWINQNLNSNSGVWYFLQALFHVYIYIYVYINAYIDTHTHMRVPARPRAHIYLYIYINTNFVEHNRHFLSTYFLVDPFILLYYFYRIRRELIDEFSIIVYVASTFCLNLGHYQGRIYYKSDVTFVFAQLLCKHYILETCNRYLAELIFKPVLMLNVFSYWHYL